MPWIHRVVYCTFWAVFCGLASQYLVQGPVDAAVHWLWTYHDLITRIMRLLRMTKYYGVLLLITHSASLPYYFTAVDICTAALRKRLGSSYAIVAYSEVLIDQVELKLRGISYSVQCD